MKNTTGAAIARQSMSKLVLDVLDKTTKCSSLTELPFGFKDIVAITNVMVDYVENGYTKELGDRLDAIDTFIHKTIETKVHLEQESLFGNH